MKNIPGYEGRYFADTKGSIYSSLGLGGRVKKLNPPSKTGWYLQVRLCKDGKQTPIRVHRLIAMTFIPNPDNKRCVNHKNGIKTDNRVENLEWVTHSENTIHAIENKFFTHAIGSSHPKSKLLIDNQTGVFYESVQFAATARGFTRHQVKSGIRKHGEYHGLSYA